MYLGMSAVRPGMSMFRSPKGSPPAMTSKVKSNMTHLRVSLLWGVLAWTTPKSRALI
jgi:hypothetical protein